MQYNFRRRLVYLAFGITTFVLSYLVGAELELDAEQADEVVRQFYGQIEGIDQTGIFLNNVRIALAMFVPALGAGLGIFSGISTGLVFNAIAETSTELADFPAILVLLTPFGLMEISAYGLAMSRSVMLIYDVIKKRPWRDYLKYTVAEIGVVAALLLSGAIIEWQMIEQLGGVTELPDL